MGNVGRREGRMGSSTELLNLSCDICGICLHYINKKETFDYNNLQSVLGKLQIYSKHHHLCVTCFLSTSITCLYRLACQISAIKLIFLECWNSGCKKDPRIISVSEELWNTHGQKLVLEPLDKRKSSVQSSFGERDLRNTNS